MKKLRAFAALVLTLSVLGPRNPLQAQVDPRQVLAGMIYQVSTGTENPSWYSPVLYQTIAMQTSNSGVYPQLRQLGTVQNVVVTQWLALPTGMVYAMTAQHQFGMSFWEFGIGTFTNRIEYATFNVGQAASRPAL